MTTEDYETLGWTLDDDGVAVLTLDRPDAEPDFTGRASELPEIY